MQFSNATVKIMREFFFLNVFFLTYQANFYKIDTWQELTGQVLWGVEEGLPQHSWL